MKFASCLSLLLSFNEVLSLFWGNSGYGNGVTYQLYTKRNPVNGQPLIYANWNSIASSNFDNSKPTRLIIHGFGQNGRSNINRDIKNSYLARNDYNVIIADWSSSSSQYYQYARNSVGATGIAVSKFIEWLNINYSELTVVGYDLGAHVAGIAGKNSWRGRINRIVGLDPSLPLFNENTSGNRLSIGDAALVEVFHSNGGQLGIFAPIGNNDYYINDGRVQPECVASNNDCSHYRSIITFTRIRNLQNNYVIRPCETVADVATGCSLDPIEFILEEVRPSGIYQINTVNAVAEAINNDAEIIP